MLTIGPQLFSIYWPGCPNGQEQKCRTTKSPLMQDWVFRLGLCLVRWVEKSINLSLNDPHGKCILFGLMVCTSVFIFRAVGSGGGETRRRPHPDFARYVNLISGGRRADYALYFKARPLPPRFSVLPRAWSEAAAASTKGASSIFRHLQIHTWKGLKVWVHKNNWTTILTH